MCTPLLCLLRQPRRCRACPVCPSFSEGFISLQLTHFLTLLVARTPGKLDNAKARLRDFFKKKQSPPTLVPSTSQNAQGLEGHASLSADLIAPGPPSGRRAKMKVGEVWWDEEEEEGERERSTRLIVGSCAIDQRGWHLCEV